MPRSSRRHTGVTYLGKDETGQRWYRIRTQITNPKTGRAFDLDHKVKANDSADAASQLVSARAEWLRKHTRVTEQRGPRRIGEAMLAWYEDKRSSLKPSTASTYKSAVTWWSALLGDQWISETEPRDVRDALEGAREGGDASDTVDGRLRVLRTFARASKCAAIVEGVVVKRDVREDERIEDEGRGLELHELRAFLAAGPAATNASWWPRAWALVATMAWTGMRFGEASALEWRDVDLDEGTIRVRRAQWRGIVGHVKAKASKRLVVIPAELVEVLREHRRALGDQGFALVFPSRRKGASYVSNTHVRKTIERVVRAAKIDLDGRPTIHCLRHTYNNCLRQNASELVRRALVGHADDVSGERYSAVSLEERRAAVGGVVRMIKGDK